MTGPAAATRNKDKTDRRAHSLRVDPLRWSQNQALLLSVALVAATFLLYYPVRSHPFLNYDDDVYITANRHVQTGLNIETVKWAFTSFRAANWHPLTWMSHALDCQAFGLDPSRHHETNLALHIVNVWLLFWVLRRATGRTGPSAMVAALFAVHPINVESVAWVAERKNLLSMTFFLLALAAYGWYARKPAVGRYLAVAAAYALGLMAKPQVITLPFVLLLWDYWPLQRMYPPAGETREAPPKPTSWLILEKLPLLVLTVASGIVTYIAQYEGGTMSGPHWQPFAVRLENAIVAYARYLGKAVWPSKLAMLYPHPGSSLRLWQVLASLVLLLAISALVIEQRRRRRYLLVGWLWFLGTLVPMIGVVQVGVQAMADRYAYLPFVGLFIMVAWLVSDWAGAGHIARAWQWGVSLAILVALAVAARQQLDRWADNNLLWWQVVALETQAVKDNPRNWVSEDVLAHALLKLGEVDAAIPHFQAAMAIHPSDPDANVNYGTYEQRQNNFPAAIAQYKKVIALTDATPKQDAQSRAQAFSNLGFVYIELKDYAEAKASFAQAVESNPDDAKALLALGLASQKLGDLEGAIRAYRRSLDIAPVDWEYLLLAQALDDAGRHGEASAAIRRAAAVSQNFTQAERTAKSMLAK